MAGGDFVVSNVPNLNAIPIGGSSLGDIVDTGATQDLPDIEFNIGGTPGDGNQVDIFDSQDGTNFTFLHTLNGGNANPTTIVAVNRYMRTVRQQGTAAIVVQWGKATSSSSGSGINWLLNGNPSTAGAGIGPLDGSTFNVGGLSTGSTTAIASGATAPITITAANTLTQVATAGNITQRATAGGFSFGANRALPATGAGQVAFDYATSWTASLAGVSQIVAGAGLALAGGGTGGIAMGAGAAALATVANTFSLITGAAGVIQIGHEANAHTVQIADDGTTAQVVSMGSAFGASSLLFKSGTAGFALNAALPGTSGVTIDTPAAGALLLAPANATSFQLGSSVTTGGGAVQVGVGVLLLSTGNGGQTHIGNAASFPGVADSIQLRTLNNGPIALAAAGTGQITIASGTGTSSWSVGASGTLNIAADANAHTVSIATGAAVQTLTMGSATTTSATSILGGVSGAGGIGIGSASPGGGSTQIESPLGNSLLVGLNTVTVTVGSGASSTVTLASGGTINVGANAVAQAIQVGNATGATSLALKAGSGGLTLANNGVTWTWTTADGVAGAVGGGSYLTSNGAGALTWRQTQSGTATLTGGTVTVAMNVTANTRITMSLKGAPATLTTLLVTGTRSTGAPGSIVFNGLVAALTVNGADNTTAFDWRADG